MNEPWNALTSSLVGVLRSAAVDPGEEQALKARVHARLGASLLGLAPTLGAGLPVNHVASSVVGKSALVLKSGTVSKGLIAAWLVPVFAVGMLAGVVLDKAHTHGAAVRAVRSAAPAAPLPADAPPERPATMREPTLSPESLELISEKRVASSAPAASVEAATSLAVERRLLDGARQALTRGEPAASLAPLEEHSRRFPKGMLAEEREALAVRSLSALGNQAAALARAESFHRRFPQSLFTPAVDNAIAQFSRRNSEGEPKP